ncbi:hypothetical protein [Streptomyces tsukubensis]|uniref:hypothetical protein n=1 Tax=Streptomyces tsukubensis TaxID=83656 RepID=UPI001D04EA2E|nr:hypothetical protein [Streptomyces tsukubensis]
MLDKTFWLRAAAPAAVLALTLTACGGSDSKDTAAETNKGGSVSKGQDKADEKEAGTKELGVGESVTSPFKEDDGKITYEIVAQKVDVGTAEDAKKLVDDPKKAAGLVPVVAHLKYTNKGGGVVSSYPEVGDNVEIHADGTRGNILIGAADDAPGCESDSDIEKTTPPVASPTRTSRTGRRARATSSARRT